MSTLEVETAGKPELDGPGAAREEASSFLAVAGLAVVSLDADL